MSASTKMQMKGVQNVGINSYLSKRMKIMTKAIEAPEYIPTVSF
jgi:hypothetical protein